MPKISKRKKILWTLFVIISITLLIVIYNFVVHIIIFNNHKQYFEKPIEEQVIMDWMSINYIERTYEINLEDEFWYNVWIWSRNSTLADYCEKYKLNCSEIMISIENNKNGN